MVFMNTSITVGGKDKPDLNSLANIRLITLDLDDTVWPCDSVIQQAEAVLIDWLQGEASRLTAVHDTDSLRQHRLELMQQHPEIAHDITTVRFTSLSVLLEECGYSPNLAEEAMTVFLEARNQVFPFPDVLPVLEILNRDYCIVSLTNGNADVQRTPLKDCFHFSFNAAEAGAAKPAPNLFHCALERAGVEPIHALHIGDDPERDVLAAKQVGMHTVWMNRTKSVWPDNLSLPDAIVQDFYELAQQLRG